MLKKIFITIIFILFVLINTSTVKADPTCDPNADTPDAVCPTGGQDWFCEPNTADPNQGLCIPKKDLDTSCNPTSQTTNHGCKSSLFCNPSKANPSQWTCQKASGKIQSVFGKIQPPSALQGFIGTDTTGASAISKFLSNLIALIYVVAAIVLIFMILWGAFDWMISEGDKEKVANARNRILNAIIGIILFAVAFAIIRVIGQFTGFTFFQGQNTVQTGSPAGRGNSDAAP